jgi:hypothetical protein
MALAAGAHLVKGEPEAAMADPVPEYACSPMIVGKDGQKPLEGKFVKNIAEKP